MAKYAKLANYMILLDAVGIKIFEFIRSIMLTIKNTVLFGFVFLIVKESLKLDNKVFTLVKNLNESVILLLIMVLLVKITMSVAMNCYNFDEFIDDLSIKSQPIIQTILYKLIPIGLASQIALEMNQSQLVSNLNGLVINFLFVLPIIKLMTVMITKINQSIIYEFEYMFNKQINEITIDEYDKLKFVDIIDRTILKSYKSGQTIDTYRLKIFKLLTFNVTDYGLRKIEQYALIAQPPINAMSTNNLFTKIKLV